MQPHCTAAPYLVPTYSRPSFSHHVLLPHVQPFDTAATLVVPLYCSPVSSPRVQLPHASNAPSSPSSPALLTAFVSLTCEDE